MPFLRIVRDKRGYEYFSLVQQMSGRRGKVRQQLLYWFRTPPNIRVGRQALDDDVTRVLEAQNPDLQFDWGALRETPPLPPSAEPWRERRRAERAARQLSEDAAEAEPPGAEPSPGVRDVPLDAHDGLKDETRVESPLLVGDAAQMGFMTPEVVPEIVAIVPPVGAAGSDAMRRRRRRRGRRAPSGGPANAPGWASTPSEGASTPAESPAPSSTGHEETIAPGEEE